MEEKEKVELTDGFVRPSERIVLRRSAVTGGQDQKAVETKPRFKWRNLHLVLLGEKTKKSISKKNYSITFYNFFYTYWTDILDPLNGVA